MQRVTRRRTPRKSKALTTSKAVVTEQLRSYATRGVFSEFSAEALPRGRMEYRIVWLTTRPLYAVYDPKMHTLKWIDLLPAVPPRSAMDRALRDFLRERRSRKLPAHRRLQPALIPRVRCVNAKRTISLALSLSPRQVANATRRAVALISEIFQNFLMGPYHEYMVRNFGVAED